MVRDHRGEAGRAAIRGLHVVGDDTNATLRVQAYSAPFHVSYAVDAIFARLVRGNAGTMVKVPVGRDTQALFEEIARLHAQGVHYVYLPDAGNRELVMHAATVEVLINANRPARGMKKYWFLPGTHDFACMSEALESLVAEGDLDTAAVLLDAMKAKIVNALMDEKVFSPGLQNEVPTNVRNNKLSHAALLANRWAETKLAILRGVAPPVYRLGGPAVAPARGRGAAAEAPGAVPPDLLSDSEDD